MTGNGKLHFDEDQSRHHPAEEPKSLHTPQILKALRELFFRSLTPNRSDWKICSEGNLHNLRDPQTATFDPGATIKV